MSTRQGQQEEEDAEWNGEQFDDVLTRIARFDVERLFASSTSSQVSQQYNDNEDNASMLATPPRGHRGLVDTAHIFSDSTRSSPSISGSLSASPASSLSRILHAESLSRQHDGDDDHHHHDRSQRRRRRRHRHRHPQRGPDGQQHNDSTQDSNPNEYAAATTRLKHVYESQIRQLEDLVQDLRLQLLDVKQHSVRMHN